MWNPLRFWWDSDYSSVMKHSQGLRCMTGLSHLKMAEQRLKHAKTTPCAGKVMANIFWDSQGTLFINFVIEQWTINIAYLKSKATYHSKWLGQSFESIISPLWQHASAHFCCNNRSIGGNPLGGTATLCL